MRTPFFVLLLFTAALGTAAAAPEYYDYGQHIHWLDQSVAEDEEMTSIAPCEILGATYWVATGKNSGLSFYSLGPEGPTLASSLPMAGVEQDVVVAELFSYVIAQPDRLSKVMTANPAAPSLVWTDHLPAAPLDLDRAGSHLLVACGTGGLLVYDPTESYGQPVGGVGAWTGTAREVKTDGNGLAVVRGDDAVVTLDLSDPAHPTALDTLEVPSAGRLLVRDGLAYVSDDGQLLEIDLSDPSALAVLRTLPGTGITYGSALAFVDGGILMGGQAELHYLDLAIGGVTWKSAPFNAAPYPVGIVQSGSYLGVVAGEYGLHTLAWRPPRYAPSSLPFGEDRQLYGVAIEGDLLFARDRQQVYCYRLDLSAPALVWVYNSNADTESITDMAAGPSHLYLGYSSGRVRILQLDGLTGYLVADFLAGGGQVYSVAPLSGTAAGHLAVFVDPDDDGYFDGILKIYNVVSPSQPVLTDSVQNDGYSNLRTTGSTVVLWDVTSGNNGVQLYDLSDPTQIVPGQSLSTPAYSKVSVNGDHLYVIRAPELRSHDIGDPHAVVSGPPVAVPFGAHTFFAHGDAGYLVGTQLVMDLGDPLAPRTAGSALGRWMGSASYGAAGDGHLVFLHYRDLVHMAEQRTGRTPVAEPLPAAASLPLAAYPNPFNPRLQLEFEMPSAGEARARIFDVRGRRVAELSRTTASAGPVRLVWNGTTGDGGEAPSGVYFVRITTPAGAAVRKVLLAR